MTLICDYTSEKKKKKTKNRKTKDMVKNEECGHWNQYDHLYLKRWEPVPIFSFKTANLIKALEWWGLNIIQILPTPPEIVLWN